MLSRTKFDKKFDIIWKFVIRLHRKLLERHALDQSVGIGDYYEKKNNFTSKGKLLKKQQQRPQKQSKRQLRKQL